MGLFRTATLNSLAGILFISVLFGPDFCPVLSLGRIPLFPFFFFPLTICFYVLGRADISPGIESSGLVWKRSYGVL